ncbi:ATP-binding cassette domain-containing protein [Actinomadura viridis]|uniref:branched-chain amino acid ABC transporter ATP-binding protein/permease n=1 Tax=Actinomadura viridis TaxID=58110 RepID=UPI00369E076D
MGYYLISLMGLLPIFVILGISFNLLLGYGGLLSVSHGGFFGVGAYATAILIKDFQLEFLPAVGAGAALAGVMSLIVGYAAGRLSDEFLFIVTIATQVALVELFNNLEFTGRSAGISGIPRPTIMGYRFDDNLKVAILAWVFCAVIALVCWRVVRSPYGRLLKALREDVPAARSLGKRALWTKVTVFAFSSAIAGIAGGLYATHTLYISPAEFTVDRSVEILSITIIGGLAAYWGPFVGAAVVLALPEALTFADIPDSIAGPINGIVYTTIVLLLLIYRPQGIFGRGAVEEAERAARRKAGRKEGDGPAPPEEPASAPSLIAVPQREGGGAVAERAKVLRCEGIGISFGGLKAVDDVTLSIRPGRITALVGPNGAGKTTVFNLLSGALKADTGRTFYGDQDISALSIERRAHLGVVRSFQEVRLFENMTVLENIHVATTDFRKETLLAQFSPMSFRAGEGAEEERAERMLHGIGLHDKRHALAGDLSYAEQKMLMMGRLLATGASCYLLDEPMSGLDQGARAQLSELLRRMVADGTSICIVEHSMQVVREVASWVMFLDRGRLLTEGTPEEVMNDPTLTALYFGQTV